MTNPESLPVTRIEQFDGSHEHPVVQGLRTEIARYRAGIREIQEYLEAKEPRVGDATFTCEALLAR